MLADQLQLKAEASPQDADEIQIIVERFEVDWKAGRSPKIDQYLVENDRFRLPLLMELINCEMRIRLEANEPARIEEYFAVWPELMSNPSVTVELIVCEHQLRKVREPDLQVDEFVERFSHHSTLVLPRLNAAAASSRTGEHRPLICPKCGEVFQLPEIATGGELKCPSCKYRIAYGVNTTWDSSGLRKIGRFQTLSYLGQGAFGEVFQAHDPVSGKMVAIKIPRPERLRNPRDEANFYREARNAGQLSHPGIVPLMYVDRADKYPFIVYEFIDGMTLRAALEEGKRFDLADIASIIRNLALALDYAHRHDVVHRDVKTENIMLQRRETASNKSIGSNTAAAAPAGKADRRIPLDRYRIRLMDFGLALRREELLARGDEKAIVGTYAYMSPEQARGDANQVDGRSDIYSLGVVMYELLTGQLPFRGDLARLRDQLLHEPPQLPQTLNKHVPAQLEFICLKCLEKSPENRYSVAAELAQDLEQFLREEDIGNPTRRWSDKLLQWNRREPALVLRVVVFTIFFVMYHLRLLVPGVVDRETYDPWVILGVLASWTLASFGLQRALSRARNAVAAIYAWCVVDVVMLTALLTLTEGLCNPAFLGYLLLIVGSGVWYRRPVVWLASTLSVTAYCCLLLVDVLYHWPPHRQEILHLFPGPFHMFFVLSMVVAGMATDYLVLRVRVLSRFLERERDA